MAKAKEAKEVKNYDAGDEDECCEAKRAMTISNKNYIKNINNNIKNNKNNNINNTNIKAKWEAKLAMTIANKNNNNYMNNNNNK